MNNVLSSMMLSAWQCAVTLFGGYYDPLPADELEAATFAMLCNFIAPGDGPIVGLNKDVLPFFIPCLLKVAPLSAKMHAKTGRQVGKQRSSAHVTVAWFLVLDVDGLTQDQFDALLNSLRAAGLTFLVYSTHSYGRPDKPGIRARLVVPVDCALNADDYKGAWLGFDLLFCNGAIAAKDDSGKAMSQQQGVWSSHPDPDRMDKAFRFVHKAGLASADRLIAEGQKVCRPKIETRWRAALGAGVFGEVERRKVIAALRVIDPNGYTDWVKVCACLAALRERLGDDSRSLWLAFSERADDAHKAKNNVSGTDPEAMFDNMQPDMSTMAAMGTLMAMAKAEALSRAESGLKAGSLNVRQREAIAHLRCYHLEALRSLFGQFGLEVVA